MKVPTGLKCAFYSNPAGLKRAFYSRKPHTSRQPNRVQQNRQHDDADDEREKENLLASNETDKRRDGERAASDGDYPVSFPLHYRGATPHTGPVQADHPNPQE